MSAYYNNSLDKNGDPIVAAVVAAEGVDTMAVETGNKEERINWIQERITARSKQIDNLVERIQQMQKANSRDLLKLDETRLLKDIRDGRVKLVHAETGREISVHVFNNPK